MSNENTEWEHSVSEIHHVQEKRVISDRNLVDYAPSDAERYFVTLRDWISDECRYALDIIENLHKHADTTGQALLDGLVTQIRGIQEKARNISAGVIGQNASINDQLRTDYVSEILKRCLDLLPLVDMLYGIRQNIDETVDTENKTRNSLVEN